MSTPYKYLHMDADVFAQPPKRVLWGVAPTGEPHFGYVPPLLVLRKLKTLGSQIITLVANWHGYLDSQKTQWSDIEARTQAYRNWFISVGFPDVIETSSFYVKPDYMELMFRMTPSFVVSECLDACETTVKAERGKETAAEIIYTITQIIDIEYLDIDCALCGIDEAPIYKYGLPILQRDFQRTCHGVYVPLVPGLLLPEMHASTGAANKMMLSDTHDSLIEKIANHCVFAKSRGSQHSQLAEFILGPIAELMPPVSEIEALQGVTLADQALPGLLVAAVERIFGEIRS